MKFCLIILFAAYSTLSSSTVYSQNNILINCRIYDEKLNLLRDLTGKSEDIKDVEDMVSRQCLFLDDGSFVRQTEKQVARYDQNGKLVWERTLPTHHQLNRSRDGSSILVMSKDLGKNSIGCYTHFDVLEVLDADNGKTRARFSLMDHPSYLKNPDPKNCSEELSHFNTFNEIPENPIAKVIPEFKAGNYLAYDVYSPYVFILDHDLKKVILHKEIPEIGTRTHDVKVSPNGTILYYKGHDSVFGLVNVVTLNEFDPISKERKIVFPVAENRLSDLSANANAHGNEKLFRQNDFLAEVTYGGGFEYFADRILTSQNIKPSGNGYVVLTDRHGHIVWRKPNPYSSKSGQPDYISYIRSADLDQFLKNSKAK